MESLPINLADLVVLGVLLISAVLALSRGLVHEVLGIGAWVGAALVTLYTFTPAAALAGQYIEYEVIAEVVAGAAIFIVSLAVFSLISRALARRVHAAGLGALDRTLGFLFGLLRGALILCLAWMLYTWLLPPQDHPDWIRQARSRPLIEFGSTWLRDLVPKELRLRGEAAAGEARDAAEEAIDTGQTMQQLLQPSPQDPAKDTAPEAGTGYNDKERGAMERAIEAIQ